MFTRDELVEEQADINLTGMWEKDHFNRRHQAGEGEALGAGRVAPPGAAKRYGDA